MAYKDSKDPRLLEARRKHYHANKQQYRDRANRIQEELKLYIREFKSRPCTDCGVEYPWYVMQLDHLPEFDKSYEPARLHKTGSWAKVHEELAKCEVVCANCHAERTHMRLV